MGSLGSSDWEEEHRGNSCISKRLKIPKKLSDDFITVDYALVPRKLRSAAKKRSSGSVSPQLLSCKKHNRAGNGDELAGKNGLKKLKLSMEQGISVRQERHVSASNITKDEEEVAEALYALADMFPPTSKDKTELSGEPSKLESVAFSNMEMFESGVVLEKETEIKTISRSGTKTNSQSSNVEGSAEGEKIQSSSDGSWIKSLVKNSSLKFHTQEPKADPPSTVLNVFGSSTSKFSAISQPQHLENSFIPKKGGRFQVASEKPWKKCCTHVHVSNLINELKKADTLQMHSTQAARFEELNRGGFINSYTSTKNTNNVFPLVSTSDAVSSAAETGSDEIRNAVLLHKRLLQDQQHTVSASQFFTLQNLENLDIFPLPTRGARGESSHGRASVDQCSHGRANVDQRLGSVAQLHLPYLHSKNQRTIPFLLPQNYYSTDSSSGGGTTVAQQIQLPSYQSGRNYGRPTGGATARPKQQTWKPQLQQNWCDQLRENWKAGQVTALNISNWQNGVQDGQSLPQFAPLFSPSHSSLGVFGQNHAPRHQQQQPSTMPTLFLPPSREQGQPHLHYDFLGSGGRHPDSVQPALQLL
ncbi:hypothetical protein LIER_00906 [Lithospermum erythrorhizon]|uniref:Uncharacterized protein n=1 Tax=Lithospermum erythrorhizon TaxID=34254 RepID=A0AAV3NLG8_LITER